MSSRKWFNLSEPATGYDQLKLNMGKKTKILYLSASPEDQEPLQSDSEFRQIFEKADPMYFEMISRSKMKAMEFVSVLVEEKPQIVHFSGHGSPEEIFLEDETEESSLIPKGDVIEVFRHLSKKPRLIFLNACWTANSLEGLSSFIDFVIATRKKVFDKTAIDFAVKFYELLGHGEPVKNTFDLTKTHFEIKGLKEEVAMYRLFVRDGARDRIMIKPSLNQVGKREINNIVKIKNGNVENTTINQGNNY